MVFETFLQLLIYSLLVSIVDNRLVLHRNTFMNTGSFLSSALWISKSRLSHWLPAIQIFRLSNLIHIPLFKLYQFYTYTPGIPISHFVYEYLMSLNVLKISFDFPWVRGPTHSGNVQSFFSVSIPRTVCAFVSLRHDIILQQYIDTFLKTVSPNFIQTASFCRFEKFRNKWNPNRAPLDYPLDLTK